MKKYLVYTPIYDITIPILDDGTGPSEPARDVVEVEAKNKREAKVIGVRKLRKEYPDGWFKDHEGNPFTGIIAEDVSDFPEE